MRNVLVKTCARCAARIAYAGSRYCADCGGWAVAESLKASAAMIGVRCVRVCTFAGSDAPVPEPGSFGSRHRFRARTYVSLRLWTARDHERALQYAPRGQATDQFVDMLQRAFPAGSARAIVSRVVGWWDYPPEPSEICGHDGCTLGEGHLAECNGPRFTPEVAREFASRIGS